jgi:hypothetical protein
MATLLTDKGAFSVTATDGLWVGAADTERATGWSLQPEGMCRDALCVPLATSAVRGDRVDLAAFWHKLGAPVVQDGDAWALGASPEDRSQALAGLTAPDFELPDLAGVPHRLSALRRRRSSSPPGRPGEAAALTCPCGRPCTTRSRTRTSWWSPSRRRAAAPSTRANGSSRPRRPTGA